VRKIFHESYDVFVYVHMASFNLVAFPEFYNVLWYEIQMKNSIRDEIKRGLNHFNRKLCISFDNFEKIKLNK